MMGKSGIKFKKVFLCLFLLLFSFYSQPQPKEEKRPEVRLGEVAFQIRKVESALSPLKILEIHAEILNRSQRHTVPANSIKLAVVPKEVKTPDETPPDEFNLVPDETMLTYPLPPRTGRIMVIGFSLPKKRPISITFEVQINPPDGGKKMVTWEER